MTEPRQRRPLAVEELPEARWERIERRLLEARERERAAEPVLDLRPRRLVPFALGVGALALAAGAALFFVRTPAPAFRSATAQPTRVVTGPGMTSLIEIGDATVIVGGDTRAELTQSGAGAIRVALDEGTVDCEVAPRVGRAPFEVVAGATTVTVVGTRFQVERRGAVKVTVTRGRVAVRSVEGERHLAAGESWQGEGTPATAALETVLTSAGQSSRDTETAPAPGMGTGATPIPAADGETTTAARDPAAEKALLVRAESMDQANPEGALKIYRRLLDAVDRGVAARALYSIAHLENRAGRHRLAVKATEQYERRFPAGRHLEDVLWERIFGYYELDDPRRRAVARDYLDRYPAGKYAEKARQIAYW
jgi:hypothetical protein